MNAYSYLSPNAQQIQVERLMQQRQMLDSQIQMLTQPAPQPAVNVNVGQGGTQPAVPGFVQSQQKYDAGVMYIDTYDDAKKAASTAIPVMYMEKDRPYLHVKGTDGSLTTFELTQVSLDEGKQESDLQKQVNDLQGKIDMILSALSGQQSSAQQTPEKTARQARKTDKDGGANS